MERRGWVRPSTLKFNLKYEEEILSGTKPFTISKHLVMQAFELVKENAGSAGIDRQSICEGNCRKATEFVCTLENRHGRFVCVMEAV